MNGFLKSVLCTMNKTARIIRIFSKKVRNSKEKYLTLRNYLDALEI